MKLRGAVVGVGYLGQFHAQKYKTLTQGPFQDKIEFIGVCDVNKAQADKVAKENGVKAFYQVEDLIGKVDLVSIATMTSYHFQVAKILLSNGIHINVEKPMTVTVQEAEELVHLANKKGLTLCVGHSERFNPAFFELKKQMEGETPLYVELYRHAPYKSRGADVSVVHDLMIHDIDLALALDQSEYQIADTVGGKIISPTLDYAASTLRFKSGCEMRLSSSRLAATMNRSMRVILKKKIYEVNLQTGELSIMKPATDGLTVEVVQCGKGDNLLIETEAFFHACLGQKTAVITGLHGQKNLAIAEEICHRIEQNP